jgi:hypothetical protein
MQLGAFVVLKRDKGNGPGDSSRESTSSEPPKRGSESALLTTTLSNAINDSVLDISRYIGRSVLRPGFIFSSLAVPPISPASPFSLRATCRGSTFSANPDFRICPMGSPDSLGVCKKRMIVYSYELSSRKLYKDQTNAVPCILGEILNHSTSQHFRIGNQVISHET